MPDSRHHLHVAALHLHSPANRNPSTSFLLIVCIPTDSQTPPLNPGSNSQYLQQEQERRRTSLGEEMPSRSSVNLLELAIADSDFSSPPCHPARLPCIMADPSILSSTGSIIDDFPSASPLPLSGCRIIVAHHLPLRATPDPTSPSGWSFSYDHDALVLQLHSSLPAGIDVLHVGTLVGLPNGLHTIIACLDIQAKMQTIGKFMASIVKALDASLASATPTPLLSLLPTACSCR